MTQLEFKIGRTNDNREIRWRTVAIIEFNYQKIIGLSDDNQWLTVSGSDESNNLHIISNREDCYYLMAILEKSREEIESNIKAGIENLNVPILQYDNFPFLDLIKFSLSADSKHWGTKAALWLRQEDFDDELNDIVTKIICKKALDQKTSHQIFTMMRRYQRTKANR